MPTVHRNRIRNTKGQEKTVSDKIWDEMKTTRERGETRRGWTKVADVSEDSVSGKVAKVDPITPAAGQKKAVTYVPKFLEEPQSEAPPAPVAEDAPPVPPAQPPAPKPSGNADTLAVVPQLGLKVANALHAAGIGTIEALATADPKAIEAVLNAMVPPMTPKVAQIPAWQKWAAANKPKAVEMPTA